MDINHICSGDCYIPDLKPPEAQKVFIGAFLCHGTD